MRFVFVMAIFFLFLNNQARAVEYELPDIDGNIQSLDQYKGKWVVVNYWATWCGTCQKELPDLIALHEANKDKDIVVVSINFESISQPRLKAFVDDHALPFTVLRSEPIPVTPLGKVPGLPTTYIIDPAGKLVAGEVGIVTQQNLEDYISKQKLLDEYAKYSLKQGG